MITEINESKKLTKHISCECKCKFDGRICNSDQKWNIDKCWCEFKNPRKHRVCEKDYIWNSVTSNTPFPNLFAVTTCHMETKPYLVNCKQTNICI